MKTSNTKPAWFFAVAVTLLFLLFGYFGILHHEMWLDEAHHFLLARDSSSIGEMAFNARYEGHPLLWNVLLFVLTRFSTDPFYMQVLNLCIASAAAFLFLSYAPFTRPVKAGIVFSYFIFYEYGLLSRNYALSFLLLVLVCILFGKRKTHFLFLILALLLLAQTHLFAALIAVAVTLLLVREYFSSAGTFRPAFFLPAMSLLGLSFVFVAWQALPPPDHFLYQYDEDPYLSFKRFGKALSVMWKGLFPLPDFFTDHPWNSNAVIAFSKKLAIVPALLAWLVPFVLLKRKKIALLFFYSAAAGMMLFIYFSPLIVAARHCGFFFLLLITALWLADYFPGAAGENAAVTAKDFWNRLAKPLFTLLLLVQLTGSIYLYVTDWKRPFSNAKAVSEWLVAHQRNKDFILVNDHSTGPAIAAYLQRKVYYAENNSEGSFCRWNTKPFLISQDTLYRRIARLLETRDSLVLVSSRPLPAFAFGSHPEIKEFSLRPLRAFDGALVRAENYNLYSIVKKKP